jgi:hypothetical protein
MASKPVYKVIFANQGQIYEVFACAIYQSEMYGFIEVEEFVFGERSQVLVDPAEEKLKAEFAGVKRSYIPLHAIVRIDEVEKEGAATISEFQGGDKVAQFPYGNFMPKPGPSES